MTACWRRTLVAALVGLLAVTSSVAAASTATPAGRTDAGAVGAPAATAPTPKFAAVGGNGTSITTDGEEVVLHAAENQTIRGTTTLEPGTELSLNVEGESFLMSDTVTVTDRRTFNMTLDLSTVGEQDVTITVYRDETVLAEAAGRLVCETDCESKTTDSNAENATPVDGPAVQAISKATQNRTASIKILFGGADAVTVSIGGPSMNYVVNGTLHDRDGDGHATVLFHTNRAGTDAPTLGVVDGGETRVVEANTETSLDAPLDPGSYGVRLYAGPNATGELAAKGNVVVYEATAPKAADENAATTSTATTTGTVSGVESNASDSGGRFLGGVGMIAAGGVLAVVGIGVVLGLFRN